MIKLGIDAGHGGTDLGATRIDFPVTEADYNISIARNLLSAVVGLPFEPHMIRQRNDETLSLRDRGERSIALELDLVLHIHVNAHHDPGIHGGLLFHWPDNRRGSSMGDAIARALPKALYRRSPWSIPATDYPTPNDNWLQRPRAVMQHHKCTTVLIELGYMSNSGDAVALQSEAIQHGLVIAMLAGLADYWRTT